MPGQRAADSANLPRGPRSLGSLGPYGT